MIYQNKSKTKDPCQLTQEQSLSFLSMICFLGSSLLTLDGPEFSYLKIKKTVAENGVSAEAKREERINFSKQQTL